MIMRLASRFQEVHGSIFAGVRIDILFISSFLRRRSRMMIRHRRDGFRQRCAHARLTTLKKRCRRSTSSCVLTRQVDCTTSLPHWTVVRMSPADRRHPVDSGGKRNRTEHSTKTIARTSCTWIAFESTDQIGILFSDKTKMTDKFTGVDTLVLIEHAGIKDVL